MNTWHIHIQGQVQGIGFRPFVYKIATTLGMKGKVLNTSDGVHVYFNATERAHALVFYNKLINSAPPLARITGHSLEKYRPEKFSQFTITHSENQNDPNLLLTPDFGICAECSAELNQENYRRYYYPFITCTNCGPRYSIIEELPYDRDTTTMKSFKMCNKCTSEYENPLDRRYFSQTNSCPNCSIELSLIDSEEEELLVEVPEIIQKTVEFWNEGKIIAIKGIGGYLLTCDAHNYEAVQRLRKLKRRPSKPFALMYPNLEHLEKDVNLGPLEMKELQNAVSPLLIARSKKRTKISENIAPGLSHLGVMLPYTPLFQMLMQIFQKPIVCTSANISGSPIIFNDEHALQSLSGIADYFLVNNREIIAPQDDSVIKFSKFSQHKIIIRRSRGLAPTYISREIDLPTTTILASGAMLKSTFTYLHQGNTFVSQYLGNLDNYEVEERYKSMVNHFLEVFKSAPEVILADKHPDYPSTKFAESLSENLKIPIYIVQHHKAHFAAVLAENKLLEISEPVLGVIWDGTGLGDDKQIWGGEFFKFENQEISRIAHFETFNFILADKMAKEPRISALSVCKGIKAAQTLLKEKFTATEWRIYSKLHQKQNQLQTSSVGRLFDAVASLLNILDKQTYEGEAAQLLENLALSYVVDHGLETIDPYYIKSSYLDKVSVKGLIEAIVNDILENKSKPYIAAKFHYSLVEIVRDMAANMNFKSIAFSGGVFQNALLVDLFKFQLAEEFNLYFHKELSPNDENISYGQLICYHLKSF